MLPRFFWSCRCHGGCPRRRRCRLELEFGGYMASCCWFGCRGKRRSTGSRSCRISKGRCRLWCVGRIWTCRRISCKWGRIKRKCSGRPRINCCSRKWGPRIRRKSKRCPMSKEGRFWKGFWGLRLLFGEIGPTFGFETVVELHQNLIFYNWKAFDSLENQINQVKQVTRELRNNHQKNNEKWEKQHKSGLKRF